MKINRLKYFEIFRGFMAILLALAVATIFIFLISDNPMEALKYMLISPLIRFKSGAMSFNLNSFYTILAAMIPIIFTGLGVCIMFSANEFNLGGEGAIYLGGFIAAIVAIKFSTGTFFDSIFAVLMAAIVCGLMMLIPALGKIKLGASEMVSSLMLNYVILFVVMHFLNSVFADRTKGSLMSYDFPKSAKIPDMVAGGSHLTWAFIIAIIFTFIATIFMYRTKWGYAIRMIGINKSFSKYSGIKVGATVLLSQIIGGVLSGLGGAFEVLGRFDNFQWTDLPGYGWTGITIAILAKNNPAFVPLAAFFIAYLNKGCQLMSTYSDVPSEMISIIQAVIFLFFAAEQFLAKHRQKLVVKTAEEELALKNAEGGAEC